MLEHNILGALPGSPATDEAPAVAEIPGYHVNMVAPCLEGLTAYQVFPAQPLRVYAGAETVFLRFADEAEWLAVASALGIIEAAE